MAKEKLYNDLASRYDERYAAEQMIAAQSALVKSIVKLNPQRMLEVGCGTGHWLAVLAEYIPQRFGMDLAMPMLAQARVNDPDAFLLCGDATRLPIKVASLDLMLCFNALHHFAAPLQFIEQAFACLSPGGKLLIVGSDPHGHEQDWYVYQYFEGTYQTDLARFPSFAQTLTWMSEKEFIHLEQVTIERVDKDLIGREVFDDPYLQKHMCSQLALLSDQDYQRGLDNIEQDIQTAEAAGNLVIFRSKFDICMLSGIKSQ